MEIHSERDESNTHIVELPAPTAWPMVLALGLSLIIAGMVTNIAISLLGLLLTLMSAVGWFRQVLPVERHEAVVVEEPVEPQPAIVTRAPADSTRRKILPVETYKISAGIQGGLAGGVAMAVPAMLYGLVKVHSIWYAVNLLAAGGFVSWSGRSDAFLAEFHMQGLLAALAIHGVTSLLVGLLYGAMLPMFPRMPILTAGFIAPFLWSGLVYSVLGIISPILDQRIDWMWFVVSQIAFGLVAGFVVNLSVRVRTAQFQALPFAIRAGLHGNLKEPPNQENPPK